MAVLAVVVVALIAGTAVRAMAVAVVHHLEHPAAGGSSMTIRVDGNWFVCTPAGPMMFTCVAAPLTGGAR